MNRDEFKHYVKNMVDSMMQKIPTYGGQDFPVESPEDFLGQMPTGLPNEIVDELYDDIAEDLAKLQKKFNLGNGLENLEDIMNWAGGDSACGCVGKWDSSCGCEGDASHDCKDNPWGSKPHCKPDHCKPNHQCPPVQDDRWLKCFVFVCIKLKVILCLLKHGKFGLKEIKREICLIEKAIFSPTFGLQEIKREVRNLEQGVFSPTFGLQEIKSEVSVIESAVLSATFGLQEIKSEVSEILSMISNLDIVCPTTLLSDIKSEVSAIESAVFSSTFGLQEIKSEVSAIESAVFNATFGLQEIKSEVSEILSMISNLDIVCPTTLLSDIKSEVSAIESAVFSSTFGLQEIKSEVSAIESAVLNPLFGLPEIKSEISLIQNMVGGILTEINNPTFGLVEIKSEVSEILALTTEIRQITLDSILLLLSETFGLSEIKAEISAVEGAVFSSTFGLQEIKSEVSQLVFEFEQFSSRGAAQNLTTGPFLQTDLEVSLEIKAYNATGTAQSVTFTVRAIDNDSPCPGGTILATVGFPNIPSCCASSEIVNISSHVGSTIINAQTSSTFGLFLYATTGSPGLETKYTQFLSADFLPLGTFCAG